MTDICLFFFFYRVIERRVGLLQPEDSGDLAPSAVLVQRHADRGAHRTARRHLLQKPTFFAVKEVFFSFNKTEYILKQCCNQQTWKMYQVFPGQLRRDGSNRELLCCVRVSCYEDIHTTYMSQISFYY